MPPGPAGVVFAWPRIVEEFRLWQLRREPARFERYFFSADAAEEGAARRFLREPRGREALLALYLGEHPQGFFAIQDPGAGNDAAVGLSPEHWFDLDLTGPPAMDMPMHITRIGIDAARGERVRKILAHLDACVGGTLRLASFPGLEFEVLPVVNGDARTPSWRARRRFTVFARYPDVPYVCYYHASPPPPTNE